MSDATLNIAWPYSWAEEVEETASDPPREMCHWCGTPIWYGEALHPCIWEHEYCNGRWTG